MAFANLPPDLQAMFYNLQDQINKLVSGPNQAAYNADSAQATAIYAQGLAVTAQSTATQAQIQAINAGVQANIAQAQATLASTQATAAQTSANGKNVVTYSASSPSGSGTKVGDVWFQYQSPSMNIINQWVWNGSAWQISPIANTVIANLDAGKITSGTITSIEYNNGSGTFRVTPAGALTATSATIYGSIYATVGYFGNGSGSTLFNGWQINSTGITGVGTATITGGLIQGSSINVPQTGPLFQVDASGNMLASSATITGTITANGGRIGQFNIVGNDYLNYGTTYLYGGSSASGYCLLDTIKPINVAYVYAPSQTSTMFGINLSGGSLQVGTSSNFYNNPNNTTTSTANAFINATTGFLARSTSSQRYKVEIQEQTIPVSSILALTPKSYIDKKQYEDNHDSSTGLQRLLGLIAEDVIQIPVIGEMLANRNEKGEPDSVNYDRVAIALIPLLKDLNNRVTVLEGK